MHPKSEPMKYRTLPIKSLFEVLNHGAEPERSAALIEILKNRNPLAVEPLLHDSGKSDTIRNTNRALLLAHIGGDKRYDPARREFAKKALAEIPPETIPVLDEFAKKTQNDEMIRLARKAITALAQARND